MKKTLRDFLDEVHKKRKGKNWTGTDIPVYSVETQLEAYKQFHKYEMNRVEIEQKEYLTEYSKNKELELDQQLLHHAEIVNKLNTEIKELKQQRKWFDVIVPPMLIDNGFSDKVNVLYEDGNVDVDRYDYDMGCWCKLHVKPIAWQTIIKPTN